MTTPKPTRGRLWAALREYKHRDLDIGRLSDFAQSEPAAVLLTLRFVARGTLR